jgi:UDP-N-acetylmuramyl tripeptide synthase
LDVASAEAPEPHHAFEDSRRLMGANRYYAGTAVQLTPGGPLAQDAAAHALWQQHVQALTQALGWPPAQPMARRHARQSTLAFAAPWNLLFSATEINEWAWEQVNAAHGVAGFDLAQPAGDAATVQAHFAARAAAERRPVLEGTRDAVRSRGLPDYLDDEAYSIGEGRHSKTWQLYEAPARVDVPWPRMLAKPKVLVTGSNGKTTTVRLLAQMAMHSGHVVGHCCTEGVFLNGHVLQEGDYSGPAGARAVLRHPHVSAAVLETARGGLLRRGLAVERGEVAVVTNLSADHFGEYGVDGLQDLAEVKLIIAHAVRERGVLVLNADDEMLMATAQRLPHAREAQHALFAQDDAHPALQALRAAGGRTVGASNGELWLFDGRLRSSLGPLAAMPLMLGGAAAYNQGNLAAAALAASCVGWSPMAIRRVLAEFGSRPQDNPGRLERYALRGATVLIDYAHNPDGLAKLLDVARALKPQRLLLLLGQAGNREDEAIAELGRTAARYAPDAVCLKRMPAQYLRGRLAEEVPALLRAALLETGLPEERIRDGLDEETSALSLLAQAQAGDVVVLPMHDAPTRQRVAAALGH